MASKLDEVMAALPKERQDRVEARAHGTLPPELGQDFHLCAVLASVKPCF